MAYLITVGVSTDNNRFFPGGDQTRNVLTDDGLSEHSSPENVTNCTIRRSVHSLKIEF